MLSVRFRYDDTETDVLGDINLWIEPGEEIGIVGTTGAGKTTLLSLMLGLLDPTEGAVLLDGEDLATRRKA